MFTDQDLAQIQQRGSALSTVEEQLKNFQTGFPFLEIVKAATIGDGIQALDESRLAEAISLYEKELASKKVVKFVPASGAASRMFKALFAFMDAFDGSEAKKAEITGGEGALAAFFARIKDFAFYSDLAATFEGTSLEDMLAAQEYGKILAHVLTDAGLEYGSLPKGLLQFHSYGESSRTPMEEHLVEAAHYAGVKGGTAHLHFTVSPEHRSKFETLLAEVGSTYEAEFGVTFEVSFSEQKPATDTIAVDMENAPFRLEDGSVLFRPGGHGALIENLNDIDADLVFIKNIDNVVPDHLKDTTYTYKKAIAGELLAAQARIFSYIASLEAGEEVMAEVESFLQESLCSVLPEAYATMDKEEKVAYLISRLDRPVRVCGMVKNEGEPGGGPFWVKNSDGTTSLQIAESAQIDKDNADQMGIMQNSTHFNPVDLVCSLRNRNGEAYNLLDFRDPTTGFVAYKSKNGRELKAQELPGLWNGAMANWNTLFVEVPIITFNPVKTVNDLLRDQHQAG